jgi:hypothetical protein
VAIAGEPELTRRVIAGLLLGWMTCWSSLTPSLSAQTVADSALRISTVTLVRCDVAGCNHHSLVSRMFNALHGTTKPAVIRAELLFAEGEPYDPALVDETVRNLRALGVFERVDIDTTRTAAGMAIRITTLEDWTLQLYTRLGTAGGSVQYGLGVIEKNLFGTLTQALVRYDKDPDRHDVLLGFSRRRLIAGKINGAVQFDDRSDGKLLLAQLQMPWFEASSRHSATVTLDDRRDRIFQFRNGDSVPSDTLQNRYLLGRVDYAHALHASPQRYTRIGVAVQVRRDDYVGDAVYQSSRFPGSSVTGAVGVYATLSRIRKPTVVAFQTLNREEDIDLSPTLSLSLFAAPSALGYTAGHAGLAPGIGAHIGARLPHGFAWADFSASGLYTSAGLDSGQVAIGGTGAWLPGPRHQVLLHAEAGALKHPLPGTEFDLGLGEGPRAFAYHAFTGDRAWFTLAEYRYVATANLLRTGLGVGVAAFTDGGGAWYGGQGRRSGWDAGVGLRITLPRDPDIASNRFDVSWRGARPGLPGAWVFSIGRGFTFGRGMRGTSR